MSILKKNKQKTSACFLVKLFNLFNIEDGQHPGVRFR